jgi:hypothetical protein
MSISGAESVARRALHWMARSTVTLAAVSSRGRYDFQEERRPMAERTRPMRRFLLDRPERGDDRDRRSDRSGPGRANRLRVRYLRVRRRGGRLVSEGFHEDVRVVNPDAKSAELVLRIDAGRRPRGGEGCYFPRAYRDWAPVVVSSPRPDRSNRERPRAVLLQAGSGAPSRSGSLDERGGPGKPPTASLLRELAPPDSSIPDGFRMRSRLVLCPVPSASLRCPGH